MSKCIICKTNIGNIVTPTSEHYCEMCWYHENPPVLVLTKTWEYLHLFNPKSGRHVFITDDQIKKCGFRLFNKTTFFNREKNQKYKEVFIYKYSGTLRCLALKEYKAWPTKMPNCCKIGCTLK